MGKKVRIILQSTVCNRIPPESQTPFLGKMESCFQFFFFFGRKEVKKGNTV